MGEHYLIPLAILLQECLLSQQGSVLQHRVESIPQRASLFIIPAFLIAMCVWRSRVEQSYTLRLTLAVSAYAESHNKRSLMASVAEEM